MDKELEQYLNDFLTGIDEFDNKLRNNEGQTISEYLVSKAYIVEYLLNNGVDISKFNYGVKLINLVKFLIINLENELESNARLTDEQKEDIANQRTQLKALQSLLMKYDREIER